MNKQRSVKEIRVHELGYLRAGGSAHGEGTNQEYWLSTPTSTFDDARSAAAKYWGPVSIVVVEIVAADGTTGVGTAGAGSAGLMGLIEDHLGPLILNEDPFNVERLWDRMYRATNRFGQRGTAIAAISGIDIALWDLKAKLMGASVVDLLGGHHHESIPIYASRLYAMKDLDELSREAAAYRDQGIQMVKQRVGFGPKDGERGIRQNVDLVRTVREAVGDEISIAIDVYMSWTVDYALRMERELREFNLAWVEEPLLPRDIDGYERLCRVSETPIAHGEHSYTKWDVRDIISRRAVHVLQPDVNRIGGITEAQKVFALAEAHDIPVIPHSNEIHNLHLSFAKPNAPWVEYFPYRQDDPGATNTIFYEIFDGNPLPQDGRIELASIGKVGLGVSLNHEGLNRLLRRSSTITAHSLATK